MAIVDAQETPGAAALEVGASPDLPRFRLRTFVESLAEIGQLQVVDEPVALSDVAEVFDGNEKAVLLRRVGPEETELVGGVDGGRARLAHAFGVAVSGLLPEVLRRLRGTPHIYEVSRAAAPVQQVVLVGDDADLTVLPVHLQHGLDGAPYISASMDFAIDPATGLTNTGMRRLMLRGTHETGIDLVSPSDLRALYEAATRRGERLPVAFTVGAHPIDHVAATMRLPVDELGLVAALRDAPLPVVKCVTSDIRIPADAEWVLEGYLDERGHVEAEGTYGEFLGYYGAVKQNPVFHLTAITHRRDALFQTATIGGRGMALTDTAALSGLRTEVMLWRALETAVREPVAVCATASSGGIFNVRIALRQRVPGEARNAIAAAFGCLANVKNVFVVDPDIDVFSNEQIDWALATRFQADRDLVVQSGLRALPLDPSLHTPRVGAKAGFDLTWPFGSGPKLEMSVPESPRYDAAPQASVRAALENGPKYFADLMAAVGSRDGREVVRELDALRRQGLIARDPQGHYLIQPS